VRRTRYQEIADELRLRLDASEFGAGQLLPSESELSHDYAASRVTVRRALETLRDDGLVDSRQGFGWFVAADPVRQSLGRLGTIESQLLAEGVRSERRVLDFRFVAAPPRVAQVLGAETVLRVRRLNLADDHPFALVTVRCPDRYGAELSRADVERSPFYELIGVELGGAVQTIGAGAATGDEAELLGVPAGDLATGRTADICVFDPGQYWTVERRALKSQGKNTPFLGMEVPGKVRFTLVGGQVVYEA